MELFRLIGPFAREESDKSGIIEKLCPTTRHFGSGINQTAQVTPRNHSFRSASLNAIVRSTLPLESKTRISLSGSTRGSVRSPIACSLPQNTGSTPDASKAAAERSMPASLNCDRVAGFHRFRERNWRSKTFAHRFRRRGL